MHRLVPGLGIAAVLLAIALACSSDSVTDPKAPPGLALALSPRADTIYISDSLGTADTAQLALSATSFGHPVTTPVGVEWSSSNAAVAVVDAQGVVHARTPGTTEITARVNDDRAKSTIVVAYRTVTVTVAPSVLTGLAGDTVTITASARDASGQLVPRTAYSFGVSDATIARIEQTGTQTARVIFLKAGTVEVGVLAGGQYGDATATVLPRDFVSSVAVNAPNGALAISAGEDATCGLLPLERGYCFGRGDLLGAAKDTSCFNDSPLSPTIPCSLVPLPIAGRLNLTSVSVGDSVACAAATDNRAYCWGSQKYGQLGNGVSVTGTSATPNLVIGAVSHAAVPLTRVSAGGNHACGLAPGGAAWCWGQDSVRQLGNDDGTRAGVNSTTPIPVGGGQLFTAITAGRTHTCGLRADGAAFCWGDNRSGQLGVASQDTIDRETAVTGGIAFTSLSAGGFHTCGLTAAGTAYCWGNDAQGQLGRGVGSGTSSTPVPVVGGLSFRSISAGRAATCGITVGGAAYCWGSNAYGLLGGGAAGGMSTVPQAVAGGRTDYSVVTVGVRHACAVAQTGAYCWGSNILGALGNELQALVQPSPQKTATPQ